GNTKSLGRDMAANSRACIGWGGQLKLPRLLALRTRIQNEPLVLRRIRVCEWEGGRSWNFDGAATEVHKALPGAEKIKQNSTQRGDEMSIKPKDYKTGVTLPKRSTRQRRTESARSQSRTPRNRNGDHRTGVGLQTSFNGKRGIDVLREPEIN